MRSTILSYLFILSFGILSAQTTIEGKIKAYEGGAAEIILPVQNPKIIGQVETDGAFFVKLEEDAATEVTAAMDKANEESTNIRMVNQSVSRAFYCDSDDVKTLNGEQVIETITFRGNFFLGILEEQKAVGKLSLASSKAFVESYFSLGKKDFVTGYYIDFYYVEEDASVKGICKTKTYTLDMKDTFYMTHDYDVELKKGWNIVKIGVTEVYEDQEGRIRPLKFEMHTLTELPEDVEFIFVPGDKL